MASHKHYEEAALEAQTAADTTGADHGVERLGKEWRAWRLPEAQNRFGHELRCEVRYCTNAARTLKGHGYEASRRVR